MSHVEAYYDRTVQEEWERLERRRIEFSVTMRALRDYLPPPPAAILDVGGGPGRYAIALTQQGYSVTLLDLAQGNLDRARHEATRAGVTLAGLIHGDALALSKLALPRYDAVLMFGPLYHLLTLDDRAQAVRQGVQQLRSGGRLFAAFISRFAPFREAAKANLTWLLERPDYAEQILETGVHDADSGFAHAHYAHPFEIVPFMEREGLVTLGLIGCEGVVTGVDDQINDLTGADWEQWVELTYRIGQDPASHGGSNHLLYIGALKGQA